MIQSWSSVRATPGNSDLPRDCKRERSTRQLRGYVLPWMGFGIVFGRRPLDVVP